MDRGKEGVKLNTQTDEDEISNSSGTSFAGTGQKNTNRRDILRGAALGSFVVGAGSVAGCAQDKPEELVDLNEVGEEITARTIAQAEKLMGLSYTPKERQEMLAGLEGRLEGLAALRKISTQMPNDLAPALVFDPRVPGRSYKSQKNTFTPRFETKAALPDNDEDIAFASVTHQRGWIDAGLITSSRLTDIYLTRIERFAPKLECFITVMPEVARAQAQKADKELSEGKNRGPLHGIPYALKDLADIEDGRTTWGAAPFKDRVATADAEIVRKLERAGAVILGKTSLGALAFGDIWFDGVTRNPWNIEEGSSGSSAGSASSTAAGLCSFAIGTETLGSLVSPSERCGLTSLRPTFGRVSRAGLMALCWSLDKAGPMCRHVQDNALILSVINGYDRDDPSTARYGFSYDGTQDLSKMKVGYVPAWFEQGDDVDRAALEAMRSLGVQLEEFTFPEIDFSALIQIVLVESAAAFADLTLNNRDDELVWQAPNAWPNTWRQAWFTSAVDYVSIDRLRRQMMIEIDRAFKGFDALIGPHFAGGALLATNCTGQPQLTVRAGFAQSPTRGGGAGANGQAEGSQGVTTHRVPRSISLWGNLFEDGKIIALGSALEEKMGVANERPPEFIK